MEWRDRTVRLIGREAVERLAAARVYVFGLGAVGSYAVEGLARAGVGGFRLVDFDVFKPSNMNRQLYALGSTLGRPKAEISAARLRDINSAVSAEAFPAFAHADTLPELLSGKPDLVVDAIDSLAPKTELIAAAAEMGTPVFSAMGAATRMDPEAVKFAPLFEAKGCPLARLVKKRLRRRRIDGDIWCVYSDEVGNPVAPPQRRDDDALGEGDEFSRGRTRNVLGSLSTLPGLFGLRLAHEAIIRLAGLGGDKYGNPRGGTRS